MTTFKDALKITRLNLKEIVFGRDHGIERDKVEYDISPNDFLRFAKTDLRDNDDRGLINSLTNAKRAIDCQIDDAMIVLGVDYQKSPEGLKQFIECYKYDEDIPHKLKIIQALNLAPSFIISKARNLRNKLEHYYQLPSANEVKEAIDIAELFIRSVDGVLKMLQCGFLITDAKHNIEREDLTFDTGFIFDFDMDKKQFSARVFKENNQVGSIEISSNNPEYYGFLRLMNSANDSFEVEESFKVILQLIGHSAPKEHITLVEYY